jgi:hypothetical protein
LQGSRAGRGFCGGDLGNVGRSNNRRHADTETADDAEDDENPEVGSESGPKRAEQEEHCGNSHDGQPPDSGQRSAGDQSSGRRAEQG